MPCADPVDVNRPGPVCVEGTSSALLICESLVDLERRCYRHDDPVWSMRTNDRWSAAASEADVELITDTGRHVDFRPRGADLRKPSWHIAFFYRCAFNKRIISEVRPRVLKRSA